MPLPRFRFRLRTLMIAVAVVAIPVGAAIELLRRSARYRAIASSHTRPQRFVRLGTPLTPRQIWQFEQWRNTIVCLATLGFPYRLIHPSRDECRGPHATPPAHNAAADDGRGDGGGHPWDARRTDEAIPSLIELPYDVLEERLDPAIGIR